MILALCLSLLFIQLGGARRGPVDLTMKRDARGTDVVRSVLSKMEESNVFDTSSMSAQVTEQFIREMAYVETMDGTDITANIQDGGIWGMTNEIFEETQLYDYPELFANICRFFCVDWMNLRYNDLRNPLLSGLAVRVVLFHLNSTSRGLPDIAVDRERANYWISYFGRRNKLMSAWPSRINQLRNLEVCRIAIDVTFVLDSSGSIGVDNYQSVREYTHDFTQNLLSGGFDSRVGIILYGYAANLEIGFDFVNTNGTETLLNEIRNLTYLNQATNTPEGLCLLSNQPWRTSISTLRVAIVLTDGQSNLCSHGCPSAEDDSSTSCPFGGSGTVASTAAEVHQLDPTVLVYAIGVGGNYVIEELEDIATSPKFVDELNFTREALNQNQYYRSFDICYKAVQPVPIGEEQRGTVQLNSVSRLSFSTLANEGVTARICIDQGSIVVYGSYSSTMPNSAFHDFSEQLVSSNSISCLTTHASFSETDSCSMCTFSPAGKRKRQANDEARMVTLYITIEGRSESESQFSVNSSIGNISFDIDECAESSTLCGENSECRNTDGGYFCECVPGYEQDQEECTKSRMLGFFEKHSYGIAVGICIAAGLLLAVAGTILFGVLYYCNNKSLPIINRSKPDVTDSSELDNDCAKLY